MEPNVGSSEEAAPAAPGVTTTGGAIRERVDSWPRYARFLGALVAGLVVALAYLGISRLYPVPIVIGALPGHTAVALAIVAALAVMALLTRPASRKPSVDLPVGDLYRLMAWWIAVGLALTVYAFGSWREWGVIFLFIAIGVGVKAISVFTYIKQDWEFGVWQPFVAIMGIFALLVGIGQFLGRPYVPPPIQAALDAYGSARTALQTASRSAPDLSSIGMTLQSSGDIDIGGLPATLFIYHSSDGTPVDLYEASIGFPKPLGSSAASGPSGWWINMDSSYVRGGSTPTDFMVVAYWKHNVDVVARTLAGDQ